VHSPVVRYGGPDSGPPNNTPHRFPVRELLAARHTDPNRGQGNEAGSATTVGRLGLCDRPECARLHGLLHPQGDGNHALFHPRQLNSAQATGRIVRRERSSPVVLRKGLEEFPIGLLHHLETGWTRRARRIKVDNPEEVVVAALPFRGDTR